MLSSYLQNFFRFILLVLVQVLILNNIQLSNYINPYLYILFILLLPVQTPKILLLTLSFFLGLTIDLFTYTPGLHAAACVFAGFCRPALLRSLAPRDGYEADAIPAPAELGFGWFLTYSAIMVLLHHIVLFYLEVFQFDEFFSTLGRLLVSAFFTLLLIMVVQYLFGKGRKLK